MVDNIMINEEMVKTWIEQWHDTLIYYRDKELGRILDYGG